MCSWRAPGVLAALGKTEDLPTGRQETDAIGDVHEERVRSTESQGWAGTVATCHMMETVCLEPGLNETQGHKSVTYLGVPDGPGASHRYYPFSSSCGGGGGGGVRVVPG